MEHNQDLSNRFLRILAWILSASFLTLKFEQGIFLYSVLGYGLWLLILLNQGFSFFSLLKVFLLIGIILASLFRYFAPAFFWQFLFFSLMASEKVKSSRIAFLYRILQIFSLIFAFCFLLPYWYLPLPAIWFLSASFSFPVLFVILESMEIFLEKQISP